VSWTAIGLFYSTGDSSRHSSDTIESRNSSELTSGAGHFTGDLVATGIAFVTTLASYSGKIKFTN